MKQAAEYLSRFRSLGAEIPQVANSPAWTVAIGLLSVLGLISLLSWGVGLVQETVGVVQRHRLQSEVLHYRQENRVLRQSLKHVGERLDSLELLVGEVRAVTRASGRGIEKPVPTTVRWSQLTTSGTDGSSPAGRVKVIGRLSGVINRRLDKLAESYRESYWKLTYTPSIWPVNGLLRDRFGVIRDRFGLGRSSFHQGIDFSAGVGDLVLASADGLVLATRRRLDYGKTVILRHRYGISTVYAHLSAYNVNPGDSVRRGQVIGFVGSTGRSTGPHLHYEVRVGDIAVNPMRYISNPARDRLAKVFGLSRNRWIDSPPF